MNNTLGSTCILWLSYISTLWCFLDNFFLLSVWSPWKKGFLCENIWGNWEHLVRYFCTGTQNGLKYEIWHEKILIHALKWKLQPFEVSPCLYRKPCICTVFRPCTTWEAGLRAHLSVTTFTNFDKIFNVQAACLHCIVWFYYVSSSIIWWFSDNFFFCLVCGPFEKKGKKIICGGTRSTWGHNFLHGHPECRNMKFYGIEFDSPL